MSFSLPWKLLGSLCFGSLSICAVKLCLISFAAFSRIRAERIASYELILLFLSAVTASINTSDTVPLAAIHAYTITQPSPC